MESRRQNGANPAVATFNKRTNAYFVFALH